MELLDEKTSNGNLKQPSRQNVIDWVSASWRQISDGIIVKSFLVCGISNALDGSEDEYVNDVLFIEENDEEDPDEEDTEPDSSSNPESDVEEVGFLVT